MNKEIIYHTIINKRTYSYNELHPILTIKKNYLSIVMVAWYKMEEWRWMKINSDFWQLMHIQLVSLKHSILQSILLYGIGFCPRWSNFYVSASIWRSGALVLSTGELLLRLERSISSNLSFYQFRNPKPLCLPRRENGSPDKISDCYLDG